GLLRPAGVSAEARTMGGVGGGVGAEGRGGLEAGGDDELLRGQRDAAAAGGGTAALAHEPRRAVLVGLRALSRQRSREGEGVVTARPLPSWAALRGKP